VFLRGPSWIKNAICIRVKYNQQVYPFKTIDAIFADEPDEIVVVTAIVYFGN
jgi:hypothetical protein